jgi:hypothetical protein
LRNIYSVIHFAEKNGQSKELVAEWKNKLGIKVNPIKAFLNGEQNAELSRNLTQIHTNVDEISNNVEKYELNVNREGLRNVIERYAFESIRELI